MNKVWKTLAIIGGVAAGLFVAGMIADKVIDKMYPFEDNGKWITMNDDNDFVED